MAFFPADGQAVNRTRQANLATELAVANTHWTRLRGLLGLGANDFRNGAGLWIIPCHGVHTLGMGFPIDVFYLDRWLKIIDIKSGVRPWRFTPVRRQAASVLELPCGTAAETKSAIGDTIEITLLPKDHSQLPA
jgi:uncharacterized membrane protein (UPF0127 family)